MAARRAKTPFTASARITLVRVVLTSDNAHYYGVVTSVTEEEAAMATKRMARLAVAGVLVAVFTLGYVCGAVSLRSASAQLPQLPGGLGGQTGGGPLAAAGQLGSSITDMEQHVSALQKNLDTLKKIQSMLTGK
jgi:hypothetical protein